MKKLLFSLIFIVVFFILSTSEVFAADRYWVGGTANWDSIAGTKWALTSGGAGGEAVPTSVDNVYFDANSGAVSVDGTTVFSANLDFTGFTGTFTGAIIRTATIYGNLTLSAGMTLTYAGTFSFAATSGTKTITSNGKALAGSITFNGSGGTFQLVDTLTLGGTGNLTLSAGTFDANSQTVVLQGTAHTITGAFTGSSSFYNLTRTPSSPAKTDTLTLSANIAVTGTFTVSDGATVTNRVLVQSSTKGTARTITAATVSVSNADFQDITGAGAASWDMSAATGGSGNAGGNTMQALGDAAFTTAQTNYWVGGTGNWSDVNEWANSSGGVAGTGRVPLSQDDVVFDASSFSAGSQTVAEDMPRAGKNINWSAVTNTPKWNFTISNTRSIFGSVTLGVMTAGSAANYYVVFEGRGSFLLTSNGVLWNDLYMQLNAPGGTLTLQDAFSTTLILLITSGTFNANDKNVTAKIVSIYGTGIRTVTMGSGTWTSTGLNNWSVWDAITVTNLTFNKGTGTIKLTGSSGTQTFAGGGLTYNNVWVAMTGTTITNVTGSNTFNDFKIDAGRTVQFTAGTVTTVASLTATGTSGSRITIGSITAAQHTLTKSSYGNSCNEYLTISYSKTTNANIFFAGRYGIDSGNNTNWIFGPCPNLRPRGFVF